MRHRVSGRKFDRNSAHRQLMYRNLVTDLLRYEKVTTTEAKAKEIRGLTESMITLGKKGGLAGYRRALGFILDKRVANKLFDEIAKRYAQRPGGYTRITKLGPRPGDGAPMAQIGLV